MSIWKDMLHVLRTGTVVTTLATEVSTEKALAAAADYAAEDVLNNIASVGQGALPWRWEHLAQRKGGSGTITKGVALCSTTALIPRLTIYLFRSQPGSTLVDNEANTAVLTADRQKYVGRVDFPAMGDLGGNSEAIATPSTDGNLPLRFKCDLADDGLWGVVVTRDAITGEVAGMGLQILFFVEQD